MLNSIIDKACIERGLEPAGLCQVAATAMMYGHAPDDWEGEIAPAMHLIPQYIDILQGLGLIREDGSVDEAMYRFHNALADAERRDMLS